MSNLINIDTLISQAKAKGVNFGKGDPYNRLRYYTKIGWLPHMVRKADESGNIKGHYPESVLEQLIYIEQLKSEGLTNDEIEKKIRVQTRFQSITESLFSKETRSHIVLYAVLAIVLIILADQLEFINLGKPKSQIQPITNSSELIQMTDNGTAFVPKNQRSVFVKSNGITKISKVNITFTQNYAPATRYWVSDITDLKGFTLQLDAPVSDNVEFNWWVTK